MVFSEKKNQILQSPGGPAVGSTKPVATLPTTTSTGKTEVTTTTSSITNSNLGVATAQTFAFCSRSGNSLCVRIYRLDGEQLDEGVAVDLTIAPGSKGSSQQSISVPDYLVALAGSSLCIACANSSNDYTFHHFSIEKNGESVTEVGSFVVGKSATAIFARNNKCFLGFPGSVGVVDLSKDTLSLDEFHKYAEQTWGSKSLKTIDCFAYDSNFPKQLCAVDDVVWPKYGYWYEIDSAPKLISTANLPSGANDHYRMGLRLGEHLILTSESGTRGGQSIFFNHIPNPSK